MKYKAPYQMCKYETKAGAFFTMRQGAYDHNSYHCIKDIYRLETINERHFSNINNIKKSFFVLLTNDRNYRYNDFSKSKIWKNYSLHDERVLEKGVLTFNNRRKTYKKFRSITLREDYVLNWENYEVKDKKEKPYDNYKTEKCTSPGFSYLIVEVNSGKNK